MVVYISKPPGLIVVEPVASYLFIISVLSELLREGGVVGSFHCATTCVY